MTLVALDPRAGDLELQQALLLGDPDVAELALVQGDFGLGAAGGLLRRP